MRTVSLLARPLTLFCSTCGAPPRLGFALSSRRAFALTGFALLTVPPSRASSALAAQNKMETGYLNATAAAELDAELMTLPGFTLEQLMELAGLSVAQAVYQVVQEQQPKPNDVRPHILVICGPGNNGGDGLVAARHLVHFGYDCTIVYPKRPFAKQPHYENLVKQCTDLQIQVRHDMPQHLEQYAAIVDAMFGFSFSGTPREPFATIIQDLIHIQDQITIVAVDVPSGWHVDDGDVAGSGFAPAVLVSLTAPKNCARLFQGRHFCGGRFVPPTLSQKYAIRMPPYPATSQVMELTKTTTSGGWEEDYAAYLAEKETQEFAEYQKSQSGQCKEETWQEQYAAYLAQKEAKEFAGYKKDQSEEKTK